MKFIYGSDLMKAAKINLKRLLMTAFVVYTAVTLINQQVAIGKLTTIQREKSNMVESITLENQKLVEMIKNASTDANIEKMAREQLGLVKPGERVYINQSEPDEHLQGGDN
jgi:cell division protein DivIC